MKYSNSDLMRAVVIKVSRAVPKTKEAKLMFAIFEQAAADCVNQGVHYIDQNSAYHYLVNSPMPHLMAIDIDPEWVRRLIKAAGIVLALMDPPERLIKIKQLVLAGNH